MTVADVKMIKSTIPAPRDCDLATGLAAALTALDLETGHGESPQWVVVAMPLPVRPPARRSDRRLVSLDYASWHAHLSGSRRWLPDGEVGVTV